MDKTGERGREALTPTLIASSRHAEVNRFKRFGATGVLGAATLILPFVGLSVLLVYRDRFDASLHDRLQSSPVWALAAVAAFTFLGGFGLLPTAALSVFTGWAFGFGLGCPTAVAGFAGAAWVNYAVARRTAGREVIDSIEAQPRWRAIHRALLGGGPVKTFLIVALLRLPTFPPFGAASVALAALGVRPGPFLLGTAVGVLPRTAAYVAMASQLQPDRFDPSEAGDWWTAAAFGGITLAVLAAVALIARQALQKLTAGANE